MSRGPKRFRMDPIDRHRMQLQNRAKASGRSTETLGDVSSDKLALHRCILLVELCRSELKRAYSPDSHKM
eukprot:1561079-Amphidinium_carterae.1